VHFFLNASGALFRSLCVNLRIDHLELGACRRVVVPITVGRCRVALPVCLSRRAHVHHARASTPAEGLYSLASSPWRNVRPAPTADDRAPATRPCDPVRPCGGSSTRHHLSANADEIFRDLKNPKMASTWNRQAAIMAPGAFTRSVGMRLAIVATAHLQARDLDHGLELGNRSVDILTRVQSSRAMDYVAEFNTTLAPWRREPAVRESIHRTRTELGVAA
jgi:hypothetical protein